MDTMGDGQRGSTRVARMRRMAVAGLAVTTILLGACDTAAITGPERQSKVDPSLMTVATVASEASEATEPAATLVDDVQVLELVNTSPFPLVDPCTGEAVAGTLEARHRIEFGRTSHINVHIKYRYSGVSPTNTSYKGSGEFMEQMNGNDTGFERSNVLNLRVFATNAILGEAADDFTLHINEHLTLRIVPPKMTAQVNNAHAECK